MTLGTAFAPLRGEAPTLPPMIRSLAIALLATATASAASAQRDFDPADLAAASAVEAAPRKETRRATDVDPDVLAGQPKIRDNSPHALSAQVLRVDYGGTSGSGEAIANGLDLGYHHRLNPYLTLGLPLKLGVVERDPDVAARNPFASADLTAQLGYPLLGERIRPYAVAGTGVVVESGEGANVQVPVGAGVRVRISQATYLTTQYEFRKSLAESADNSQIGVGLLFDLGQAGYDARYWDKDGDGISDAEDNCPALPGSSRLAGCPDSDGDGFGDSVDPCPLYWGSVRDGGCPDADADGVADPIDDCPELAGTAERRGCPAPDFDRDGVPDAEDDCPKQPGRLRGCPDADADGIADEADACPEIAGPRRAGGCPDRDDDGVADADDPCPVNPGALGGCPDRDRDGVADPDDRCPNVAGDQASGGCPEIMSLSRGGHAGSIPDVTFGEALKTLDTTATARLDRLATLLLKYPTYTVEITGHADFEEPVPNRTDLSAARATECQAYLVEAGVEAERIAIDGIGAGRPIVREGTKVERQRNRRVEFDLTTD